MARILPAPMYRNTTGATRRGRRVAWPVLMSTWTGLPVMRTALARLPRIRASLHLTPPRLFGILGFVQSIWLQLEIALRLAPIRHVVRSRRLVRLAPFRASCVRNYRRIVAGRPSGCAFAHFWS